MLEGVTEGTVTAARQVSGQNASANATRAQHLATAAPRTGRPRTPDRPRAIDRTTAMPAVQLSFIANVPEFDLLLVQDIKYILDTLACPRDDRKSVFRPGVGGIALKEAWRGCFCA